MDVAIKEKDQVIDNLQKKNKELEEYAEHLAKAVGITAYQGKPVAKTWSKTWTLKTFLSNFLSFLHLGDITSLLFFIRLHVSLNLAYL